MNRASITPERWAWGLGLLVVLGVFIAARPRNGALIGGMVLTGTLIYQQRNKTGMFAG